MARLPRYVIPGQPQHIIQRGNNRQVIFAADADYQYFRDALVEACDKHGLAVHAYVFICWELLSNVVFSRFESGSDLIEFCHLDSVFEFDSGYHLRQIIESA